MIFPSDELRYAFHKLPTITQIVCGALEFECAKHMGQVELLDVDEPKVILSIEKLETEIVLDLLNSVNSRFRRKDKTYALAPSSFSLSVITCNAASPNDFENLD